MTTDERGGSAPVTPEAREALYDLMAESIPEGDGVNEPDMEAYEAKWAVVRNWLGDA